MSPRTTRKLDGINTHTPKFALVKQGTIFVQLMKESDCLHRSPYVYFSIDNHTVQSNQIITGKLVVSMVGKLGARQINSWRGDFGLASVWILSFVLLRLNLFDGCSPYGVRL